MLIEDIAMQTDSFERDQEPREEYEYLQLQQRAEHRQGQELEGSHVIGRSQVTEVPVDISKDGDPPAPSQGVAAGYTVLVKTAVDPLYHHGGEEKTESSKGEVCFIGNLPINAVGSEYIAAHGSKFKKADLPSQDQPRTGRKAALNGAGVKVVRFSMVARKARAPRLRHHYSTLGAAGGRDGSMGEDSRARRTRRRGGRRGKAEQSSGKASYTTARFGTALHRRVSRP